MTKDEALKMALEALESAANNEGNFHDYRYAITALRQALDQLPDTTKMIDTGIDRGAWSDVENATKWVDELRGDDEPEQVPVNGYTAPPSKPWVSLTDEEIELCREKAFSINNPYCPVDRKSMWKAAQYIEAALKERNK